MKERLYEVMPPNLRLDEKVSALAKSLDAELQKLTQETRLPLHLPRLEELDHAVLDLLSWQYDALFYEPENMTLETKRRIIKQTLMQWKKVGTPYAVREMLDTFASGTKISEWFEYGGQPYRFKLVLQRLQDLEDDGETILRLINSVKNVRSWLDAFDFNLIPDAETLHAGFADVTQGKTTFDVKTQFEGKSRLQVIKGSLLSGVETNYNAVEVRSKQLLNVAMIEMASGAIEYGSDYEEDATWYENWLNWIKSRWANWRTAEIIYYQAEIIDDEINEENYAGDYLKLWLSYHNSDLTRLIVLPNPRADLTAADINAVKVDGIFIKRGYLSDKIIRSVYVEKTVTKITF